MSDFDDLLTAGMAELMGQVSTGITAAAAPGVTGKKCVLSNVDVSRELRETGMMPNYTAVAELLRADAVALGLYPMETSGARPKCTIAGRTYNREGVDDDPHDSYVRLHLNIYR